MLNVEENDIQVGEVAIHYYRTGGDKPVLILLHGFGDNGLCWSRVAARLCDRFDIVMVDARNHGKSSRKLASAEQLAADVAGLIQQLELGPSLVLGHSMGASTAARLAADYPDLVSKLLLEDAPWSHNPKPESQAQIDTRNAGAKAWLRSLADKSLQELIQFGRNEYPDWHDDDLPAWAESKQQVSKDAMQGLSLGDWQSVVGRVQCPALLIHTDGKRDGLLKQKVVDEILALNENFTAACINDAGHNTRREQFEQYISAVEAFLVS